MKKFNKRAMSVASVAAILASIAAMPAFAVESNVYSVSYETLTTAITTEDGNTVPAGSVAVTLSIDDNTGFDSNVLTLAVSDGYNVITDADGAPVVQKGDVLDSALIASAISEDGNTVCVTTADGTKCNDDGSLFTIYASPVARNISSGFVTITSTNAGNVEDEFVTSATNDDYGISVANWGEIVDNYYVFYYYSGDANDNSTSDQNIIINANDASLILTACYDEATDDETIEHEVADLEVNDEWKTYFPQAAFAGCADATIDGFIKKDDAQEVLDYAAKHGAGVVYSGNAGTKRVGSIIPRP